ncbi:MAG TPA: class I SAM-dependent methyltransferase [Acetobacteraceae bacterium]|jgi:hypothetical protein|nr:class I SAM-dependent methyltransferase [Acetobacteraceae bacterium]
MSKREKMLEGIDLRQERGIEIGALAAPIVTKAESDIRYVDWADQQTLKAKYAHDPNVDVDKIVPVDGIWGDNSLKQSLSDETGFGYAIASHVIEHVPDMIGWLGEIAEVLRPGGRLTLAIPDRRFTFDYLRQETRVGDLIDAWMRRNRRPSPANVFDFCANSVIVDAGTAWRGPLDRGNLTHYTDPRSALRMARESFDGAYHDTHCWVFTPESLLRILIDLVDLDLLPYRCARFHTTEPGSIEMFLILERMADDTDQAKAEARESFLVPLRDVQEPDLAIEVVRLRAVVDAMEQTVASLQSEAEASKAKVASLESEAETLKSKVALREGEIAALRSSTSWRITKPLRDVRVRISGA